MNTPRGTRTPMTIEQGIATYTLTQSDIARVKTLLADAGAVTAYSIPSERHIGFLNAAGQAVAYLGATYLNITPRAAKMPQGDRVTVTTADGGLGAEILLTGSTEIVRRNDGGREQVGAQPQTLGTICEIHWIARSITGSCFGCD